jgi:hypothetical protein
LGFPKISSPQNLSRRRNSGRLRILSRISSWVGHISFAGAEAFEAIPDWIQRRNAASIGG